MDSSNDTTDILDIFSNLDDAVITTDERFVITSWNRAAERLYQLPSDKAMGEFLLHLIEIPGMDIPSDSLNFLLEDKGSWRGESLHHCISGVSIWVDWSLSLLVIPGEGPSGTISIIKDISERKEAKKPCEKARNAFVNSLRRLSMGF